MFLKNRRSKKFQIIALLLIPFFASFPMPQPRKKAQGSSSPEKKTVLPPPPDLAQNNQSVPPKKEASEENQNSNSRQSELSFPPQNKPANTLPSNTAKQSSAFYGTNGKPISIPLPLNERQSRLSEFNKNQSDASTKDRSRDDSTTDSSRDNSINNRFSRNDSFHNSSSREDNTRNRSSEDQINNPSSLPPRETPSNDQRYEGQSAFISGDRDRASDNSRNTNPEPRNTSNTSSEDKRNVVDNNSSQIVTELNKAIEILKNTNQLISNTLSQMTSENLTSNSSSRIQVQQAFQKNPLTKDPDGKGSVESFASEAIPEEESLIEQSFVDQIASHMIPENRKKLLEEIEKAINWGTISADEKKILLENKKLIAAVDYDDPKNDQSEFKFQPWMIDYLKKYGAAGEDDLDKIYTYVESHQAPNLNNKIKSDDF